MFKLKEFFNLKKMSFKKLIILFMGGLVGFILLGILVSLSIGSNSSPTRRIVSLNSPSNQPTNQENQQIRSTSNVDRNNRDILAIQLNNRNDELSSMTKEKEALEIKYVQLVNTINDNFKKFSADSDSLNKRISILESKLDATIKDSQRVNIVRLDNLIQQQTIQENKLEKYGIPYKSPQGIKVNATVGNRAWIQTKNGEISVTEGDYINNKFVVKSVDSKKHTVLIIQ
ncbi:type IV secretion system protein IcmG/DotF [Yersinia ruckeri]|uniref:type IV secretion system protein IcmG/DotF n=1 Tax=Yersinia ruckeri TaxID=29486 RepID=UPI0022388E5B|nr:type IV secretion system protein IcmG/DotF [Yersinia ruckeri]MCW6559993.1 type IV secretion system protein IcmG/DotF [Yersinia ruckeri]MCW6596028.1 type IV secretion system protein IcmG/DotF [Yersinia ruckeri]